MTITLYPGDNRLSLRRLIDQGVKVHSVVTDPPYGLTSVAKRFGKEGAAPARREKNDGSFARLSGGFMGKMWDASGIERDPDFWALVYEILLPGGYVFAFSGSRTGHWQACAMEMAGFIMHPMHGWVYGCLDTETLAATPDGDKPYTDLRAGDDVICYDPLTGEYSFQPILEVVEYDYEDTAYRLVGDFGEQVVSRNHRCIIERNGGEIFAFAETLEQQEVVPVLEDLRGLRQTLHLQKPEGNRQSRMFSSMQDPSDLERSRSDTYSDGGSQGTNDHLSGLLNESVETGCLAAKDKGDFVLQPLLSGKVECAETSDSTCAQGASRLDEREPRILPKEDVRPPKSSLERWSDATRPKGQSREAGNQIYPLLNVSDADGAAGRLCDGTSDRSGASNGQTAAAIRGSASHQPRCDGQPDHQSDAVQDQLGSQKVRAWAGHKTNLVRVVPFHYVGKVWCLRVPTGAFVAVRNGVAFPTGNSGFPKAHNAAMAIDKTFGAKHRAKSFNMKGKEDNPRADEFAENGREILPPWKAESPEAAQWDGWAYGTQAQKPALEPIYLGQKPFSEKTGAANLLKHGVGAVNIDGCRVPTNEDSLGGGRTGGSVKASNDGWNRPYMDDPDYMAQLAKDSKDRVAKAEASGRHPANLILDGSPEVVAMFPHSGGSGPARKLNRSTRPEITGWGMNTAGDDVAELRDAGNGSAARFFHQFLPDADLADMAPLIYNPKAGKADRAGGNHPTVKPVALMQYLIRHITPPGGVVLDPFAGSGTTAEAARREGFDCILMEAEPEYVTFLRKRFGIYDFDDILGNSTENSVDRLLGDLL